MQLFLNEGKYVQFRQLGLRSAFGEHDTSLLEIKYNPVLSTQSASSICAHLVIFKKVK
jgi:hypothetical protein